MSEPQSLRPKTGLDKSTGKPSGLQPSAGTSILTAIPRRNETWLGVGIALIILITDPQSEWWRKLIALGLIGVWACLQEICQSLLVRRPFSKTGLGLWLLQLGIVELMFWLGSYNIATFWFIIVPARAMRYFGEKIGYMTAGLIWLLFSSQNLLLASSQFGQSYWFQELLWTSILVFVVSRSQVTIRENISRVRTEHLLRELEISHAQLKQSALQVEELAATQERNRIAREIHDSLGHHLMAINIQLEKALVIFYHEPAAAYQTIERTRQLAGETLQEVRRSVSTLRNTQQNFSLLTALPKLVEDVNNNGDFNIELKTKGSETGFSSQGLMTLYRVAQEGLTNIQKYAAATQVSIELALLDDTAQLEIRDNGKGFELSQLQKMPAGHVGGYGLQGLRERLELLNGHLQIKSAPGTGTCLLAIVPK